MNHLGKELTMESFLESISDDIIKLDDAKRIEFEEERVFNPEFILVY